ncbi:unnamed protein product, partial [Onchocerca flexuosa]|uniref:Uncharacterized protein n=1 Tax=Onchocerca flexuosa TaxID=387005 RepID=A0A183HWG3_9BILA
MVWWGVAEILVGSNLNERERSMGIRGERFIKRERERETNRTGEYEKNLICRLN